MHRPDGCTYPNCFECKLSDCQYSDEDMKKDRVAERVRQKRAANPERFRAAARMQRKRMEERDPGHYARLQREYVKRKKSKEEACVT